MKRILNFICVLMILFPSCKKVESLPKVTKPEINGVVQKGPFLNGSSIEIFELEENFSPTGKVFSSQILDNSGIFELMNISLISQYVQFKANGYYFNEITGQNSNSPITLYALTDISNRTSVNVNILSDLAKSRIEYLLKTGQTFSVAKSQVEQEILKIFSFTLVDTTDFDMLNITEEGEGNAILLAISMIMQGYRSESDLSELLANVKTDIREDGELDSPILGSLLINDARLFNLQELRQNIEDRYANLGMTVTIPNFEKYITIFIDSTTYQITNHIVYPEYSNYGENILYGDKTNGSSMAANLPKGTSLKIVIKGGRWVYQASPNGPINWAITPYDWDNEQQTFTAIESGKNCDLIFAWASSNKHTIEYYENNSPIPTRVKIINE